MAMTKGEMLELMNDPSRWNEQTMSEIEASMDRMDVELASAGYESSKEFAVRMMEKRGTYGGSKK
jgi:hypothetical protein